MGVVRQRDLSDSRDRWKIRCFGRLRIYRNDGSQVNWEIAGGATRKTKTLFAYLLQKGGHGAGTDGRRVVGRTRPKPGRELVDHQLADAGKQRWKQVQYPVLLENALRQLIAVSPDLQTS